MKARDGDPGVSERLNDGALGGAAAPRAVLG